MTPIDENGSLGRTFAAPPPQRCFTATTERIWLNPRSSSTLRRLRDDTMQLFQRLRGVRSLMLVILAVVMAVWIGALGWRKVQYLTLARYFREHASRYAQAEALHADA